MSRSPLTKRANALWSRFQESGEPALLDQAGELLRATLRDARDLRERLSVMSNLAAVLQAQFRATGDAEALGESVDLLQEALASTEATDPVRDALVLNLAAGLHARYELTGDTDALLSCIEIVRPDETDKGRDTATQARRLSLLSAALLDLYLAGGSQDLDEAVSVARIAVNLTPPEDARLASRLTMLASALSVRSEATQDIADLASAIATARRALALTALPRPQAADLAANLGALLHSRYDLTGSLTDLDEAISLLSKAMTSQRFPRGSTLRNLGAALLSRFQQSGNTGDIDEAVTLHEHAVAALPADSGAASDYLADFGRCLIIRYGISRHASDIRKAITAIEEAVRRTPSQHPRMAEYLSALADARFLKFGRDADATAAAMAIDNWQQAAAIVGAGTSVRLRAARAWATTAAQMGNWMSAAAGYEAAIGLLPELLWRSTAEADRSSLHDQLVDLPCDAAACMIEIGSPERALELLELGRSVLWTWLLGVPTDLDALSRGAPDLAELTGALARIRKEIDHTGVPLIHTRGGPEDIATRRLALAQEWDQLVAQVRSISGFEDFLRPPHADRLLALCSEGPVIVVNMSRLRCDALVLGPHGISVLPLSELTYEDTVGRVNGFLSVISNLSRPAVLSDSHYRERILTELLAWQWRTIAAPVLDHLGLLQGDQDSTRRLPRIWLCPTGPLAVLPLHAAGLVGPDGSLRGLLDHTVPSYTTTVSQLTDVRRNTTTSEPGDAMDKRPLLVSLAATPGLPGLPTASREMEFFVRSAARIRPNILSGDEATIASVLALLEGSSWVHFSCHGAAEVDEPWRSGIQLYDGLLTLTDLAAQEPPALQTVVLSSCQTSAAGMSSADESVNLIPAMQSVGARNVVGALWSVRDESAAVVAHHLYRDFNDSPADAARRAAGHLREAVMELRRANPQVPSVWACFVHYGP